MRWKKFFKILFLVSVLSILLLTACISNAQPDDIQIKDIWGRPSPANAIGVFYMTVTNPGSQADRLMSAESEACGTIEIHETVMNGDTMGMRPVEGGAVEIPAGGSVEFKTGGLHLMCIDKKEDFTLGSTIPLTLQFEKAGPIELQAEIRNP